MKQLSSSENKKSSPSELNKSNLEINRGFEFILNGGKKKQVKPFSFVFDNLVFWVILALFSTYLALFARDSGENDEKSTGILTRDHRFLLTRRDTFTRTKNSKTLMKIIAESREIIEIR